MVATSTPAASSAVKAEAGARKANSLAAAVPRSVMAVSRLTTARSARRSTPPIGPKVVAGSLARRVATAPSKWTSPPKAMVTGAPVGSLPAPARGGEVVVARGRAVVLVEVAPETPVSPPSPPPPPQPLRASAARARAATVRRPASRDTADSRLGLGEAALACHAAARRVRRRRSVAQARPGRADEPPDHVVDPGRHRGRLAQPAPRTVPGAARPPARPREVVALGRGPQVVGPLVHQLEVRPATGGLRCPAHLRPPRLSTPTKSLHWCSGICNR